MIDRRMLSLLAAAAFALPALAAAQAPVKAGATATRTTTRTHTGPLGGKTATVQTQKVHAVAVRKPSGHVVTATTKTGKSVTYDCRKAGNKTKAACKR